MLPRSHRDSQVAMGSGGKLSELPFYAALLMDHGILTRMDSIDRAAGVLSLTTCTLRVNIIHQERC